MKRNDFKALIERKCNEIGLWKGILVLFFLFPTLTINAYDYVGEGTSESPYEIATRDDLEGINEDLTAEYKLTADIDLAGENWIPIADPFTGKLHGGGHAIKNLNISFEGSVGLFSVLGDGAGIDNLHIISGSVNSISTDISGYAGAFAGQITGENVTIVACSNGANITASFAGGIVGQSAAAKVKITSCFNTGDVTGSFAIGGIVGQALAVFISDCYSNATLIPINPAGGFSAGGIVGKAEDADADVSVSNSYSSGKILGGNGSNSSSFIAAGIMSGSSSRMSVINSVCLLERIAGNSRRITSNLATLNNNYGWEGTIVGNTVLGAQNGEDVTLADAKTQSFYETYLTTWDFTNTWAISNGLSFPYFKYQSAPVVVINLYTTKVSLNVANNASVDVYKGGQKTFLTTLNALSAGNNDLTTSWSVNGGDTLYFVTKELNKAPSCSVEAIVLPDFVINATGSNLSREALDYSSDYSDIIIKSNNTGTGQLTNIENSLTVNGKVKFVKTFTAGIWYPIGFPFDLSGIYTVVDGVTKEIFPYNGLGTEYTGGGATTASEGDFWLKTYIGETNVFEYPGNGTDRVSIAAGTGYIIQFPENTEVTFISTPNPILKNTTTPVISLAEAPDNDNVYTLVPNPSVANISSIIGAEKYYVYDYNNRFGPNTSNNITGELKPFEAVVVVKGTFPYRSSLGTGELTGTEPVRGAVIDINDPVIATKYYTPQGIEVQEPVGIGVYIVKTIHASQKSDVKKVLYKGVNK